MIKVTVKFDGTVSPEAQGAALLAFERHLRELTSADIRVFKELMGDDSKLRRMMTIKQRESL